jgi:hypothetical protein
MAQLERGQTVRTAGKVRLIGALAAVLVIVMTLAIGCGGGSSDKATPSGDNNDNGSATASTSDKDTGSATPTKSSGSTSKQAKGADDYASQVCGVLSNYTDDIAALSNGPSDAEDTGALKDYVNSMVPVLNGISKDMDKINPPSEVADWHDGVVSGMSDAAELMGKMGDALDKPLDEAMTEITDLSSDMDNLSNPLAMTDLPDDYQQAFKDNADCQALQNLNFFD